MIRSKQRRSTARARPTGGTATPGVASIASDSQESVDRCTDDLVRFATDVAAAWFARFMDPQVLITAADSPLKSDERAALRDALSRQIGGSAGDGIQGHARGRQTCRYGGPAFAPPLSGSNVRQGERCDWPHLQIQDQHRPFRIGDGPSQSGARLGGRAPVLDAMPLLAPASQYVLTFPLLLEPVVYVSVFVNGTIETFGEIDERRPSVRPQNPWRYDTGRRFAVTRTRSVERSAHPLHVADVLEPDLVDDGEGERSIWSGHKLGGRPYCIQEPESRRSRGAACSGLRPGSSARLPGSRRWLSLRKLAVRRWSLQSIHRAGRRRT